MSPKYPNIIIKVYNGSNRVIKLHCTISEMVTEVRRLQRLGHKRAYVKIWTGLDKEFILNND